MTKLIGVEKHSLVTHCVSLFIRALFSNLRSVIFKRYVKHIQLLIIKP